MLELNQLHPLTRYGFVAAYHDWPKDIKALPPLETDAGKTELALLGLQGIKHGMMVKGQPDNAQPGQGYFKDIDAETLNPGKANKQSSAFGVFLAPHVLTGQNAAGLFQEINKLIGVLQKGKLGNYELKRSFSPGVAKINAGNSSMSNPRTDTLSAAFTAIGVGTKHKAAAYDYGPGDNVGLIPDLPVSLTPDGQVDGPLYRYILLLDKVQKRATGLRQSRYDKKTERFGRPAMFQGNFPGALQNVEIGAVSVLAALGKWLSEQEYQLPDDVTTVKALAQYPLLLVGYGGHRQESFNSKLVERTLDGSLHRALKDLWKAEVLGAEGRERYNNTRYKLFLLYWNRFLQFFSTPHFRNFISIRATYPPTFQFIFNQYFMTRTDNPFDQELLVSAKAYGKVLNSAAYQNAKKDQGEAGGKIYEYKSRALNQLESYIRAAKSPQELMASMATVTGRITGYDIEPEAGPFIDAVLSGKVTLRDAQDLLTVYMRLNQLREKTEEIPTTSETTDSIEILD